MSFKIKETDVKISFTFFAVFLFGIITPANRIFIYAFLTALVHEGVHVFFIKLFGDEVHEISFSLFGAAIKRGNKYKTSNIKEIFINLSAPVVNVILGVFCFVFEINDIFATINLTTGIFNLLPFYTFDGGRGLNCLLAGFFSENICEIVLTVTSVVVTVFFSFLSVFMFCGPTKNPTVFIISVYLIVGIVTGVFRKKLKL